ncbi:MAG TPA: sulfite exporter TauE/SafE family protein [Candidatus Saccharimonadales bacterium]|nr:sulfite exporter TauE/SafE family protein [Candidatus Saccharimonadales bacterium]
MHLSLSISHILIAMAAAFLAGGINSVAGGGTLVTFPALIGLGLPSIAANATSTVAIWPGALGSMWGFRREIRETDPRFRLLAIPSVIGGLIGAILLRRTPAAMFDHLVPFLILFATVLFTVQAPIQRRLQSTPHPAGKRGTTWIVGATCAQLAVGIYGGYFGAGMSIMMLTVLAFMGMEDILKMSATTSFLGFCTNGVASILFAFSHMVVWPYVLAMMFAALFGGYAAAGIARRIGKVMVRRFVIAVGFTIAIVLFVRMF